MAEDRAGDGEFHDPSRQARASMLYRRVWRWHFWAGLVCLPVLVLMAVTGGLYLFKEEISDQVRAHQRIVTAQAGPFVAIEPLVQRVLKEYPGQLADVVWPRAANRSLKLGIDQPHGEKVAVYVNPYSGEVLDAQVERLQWEYIASKLHSMELLGYWPNLLVEVVAGWTIVLVVTGVYLWWPRGRKGGVLSVRGSPRQRLWWRDAHAVTGAVAAALVLFLTLTGMPWSAVWGQQFGKLTKALGVGMPLHVWSAVPQSTLPMAARGSVPWAFEQAVEPASVASDEAVGEARAIGVEAARQRFEALGFVPGYTLRMPWGPNGVYTALYFPDDTTRQRVAHLDQYSGEVLVDVDYAQFGAVAKATEWGISVHVGRQYGAFNQWLMLAGVLCIVALALSSVVMWWKRRPAGRIAAPPRREGDRVAKTTVCIAAGLGVVFPLLGASMLVILLADRGLERLRERGET